MSKTVIFIFSAFYLLLSLLITQILIQTQRLSLINGDVQGWMEFAHQLHDTHSIGTSIWWPPLYALLLSFFVSTPQVLLIISLLQAVCYLFTLLLLREIIIITGVHVPQFAGLVAAALLLGMPSFFLISRIPLAETIFLLFYIVHAYFLVLFIIKKRFRYIIFSLLFLILATFTKPTTILLHVVEYPLLFAWLHQNKANSKRRWIALLAALCIPSLLYGVWMRRNYSSTGVFVFANVANYNLLAHNYVHLLPYTGESKFKPGDELRVEQSETIRSSLFQEELPTYIKAQGVAEPQSLSTTQIYAFAAHMASTRIMQYLPLYLLIHYLESLALFVPDNWETLRHIWPQAKVLIMAADFLVGIVLFALFVKALSVCIKKMRTHKGYEIKTIVQTLVFINICYLFSIIGPTALDDGGRFSFIFYPWLLLFFGLTFY